MQKNLTGEMVRISEPRERASILLWKQKYVMMNFFLKSIGESENKSILKKKLTNIINQIFVFSATDLSFERSKHTRSIKGYFYNARQGY